MNWSDCSTKDCGHWRYVSVIGMIFYLTSWEILRTWRFETKAINKLAGQDSVLKILPINKRKMISLDFSSEIFFFSPWREEFGWREQLAFVHHWNNLWQINILMSAVWSPECRISDGHGWEVSERHFGENEPHQSCFWDPTAFFFRP